MNTKRTLSFLLAIAGLLMIAVGAFVFSNNGSDMLSNLFVGVGGAFTVLGLGWFMQAVVASKGAAALELSAIREEDSEEKREQAKNEKVRQKAGYRVSIIMSYLLLAYVFFLNYLKADFLVTLIAACLVVVQFILTVIFTARYSKEQ